MRGITESIYWKPAILWIVDRVRIMKPIQTTSKGMKPHSYHESGDKRYSLSMYTYLSEVEYQIEAHFIGNEAQPQFANDRDENKHHNNAFYSDSKESQRRMHQAASSVLIFDEAQALPIKTLHLFNHALMFLSRHTATTSLICTATQPLLDEIAPDYGRLAFSPDADLTAGISFDALSHRTRLIDRRRTDGGVWSCAELGQALEKPLASRKHTLVVVNTREQAHRLFDECKRRFEKQAVKVVHLSNSLCPAHLRNTIGGFDLDARRKNKKSGTLLCISTSLVEAGVDLDFDLVIRDIAGLVSIIQAAGRCNRHGYRAISDCWIINLEREHGRPGLDEEIADADRALRETMGTRKAIPLTAENVAQAVRLYFKYHYHDQRAQMLYPFDKPYQTNLIDLLTENGAAVEEFGRRGKTLAPETRFRAALASAAQKFEAIDAGTRGVLVPYTEEGMRIIVDFCAAFRTPDGMIADAGKLLAKARPFTVNVYQNDWKTLADEAHALYEVQSGAGIYYLDERHYHPEKGVTLEETASMFTHTG